MFSDHVLDGEHAERYPGNAQIVLVVPLQAPLFFTDATTHVIYSYMLQFGKLLLMSSFK